MEIDPSRLEGWPPPFESDDHKVLGKCLSGQRFKEVGAALAIYSRGFEFSRAGQSVQVEFENVEALRGTLTVADMVEISKAADFNKSISFSLVDTAGKEYALELPYMTYNDFVTLIKRLIFLRKRNPGSRGQADRIEE